MAAVAAPLRLEVATCIACRARSRPGACADGCDDAPLDLVEAETQARLRDAARAALAEAQSTTADSRARTPTAIAATAASSRNPIV